MMEASITQITWKCHLSFSKVVTDSWIHGFPMLQLVYHGDHGGATTEHVSSTPTTITTTTITTSTSKSFASFSGQARPAVVSQLDTTPRRHQAVGEVALHCRPIRHPCHHGSNPLKYEVAPVPWIKAEPVSAEGEPIPPWGHSSQQQVRAGGCLFHGPPMFPGRVWHAWAEEGPRFGDPAGGGHENPVHAKLIRPHLHHRVYGPHPAHYHHHDHHGLHHHTNIIW